MLSLEDLKVGGFIKSWLKYFPIINSCLAYVPARYVFRKFKAWNFENILAFLDAFYSSSPLQYLFLGCLLEVKCLRADFIKLLFLFPFPKIHFA